MANFVNLESAGLTIRLEGAKEDRYSRLCFMRQLTFCFDVTSNREGMVKGLVPAIAIS